MNTSVYACEHVIRVYLYFPAYAQENPAAQTTAMFSLYVKSSYFYSYAIPYTCEKVTLTQMLVFVAKFLVHVRADMRVRMYTHTDARVCGIITNDHLA